MKKLFLTLCLLTLVGCNKPPAKDVATGASSATPEITAAGSGKAWSGSATDFTFTTFDGKTMKLSSYAGQPLVLNFWADWCPPCVQELPHFQESYHKYKGQFAMVGIAATSSKDAPGFVKQNGYDWTFGMSDAAFELYQIKGIPLTVFIDRNGNVSDQVAGMLDKTDFEARLTKIL